ncbi:sulfite exporter TauE/SafE family protein [Microbacterium sp. LRZ72]|uniref:sulfite exporter TauE/SafE family protein n=1 Tax=Microbacterium sp. LRZ72 TaxID=2942481 RepID=UPI0029A96883|nr:sulfite exporter TauE/SafE family protein [Microbacterium sp. LRZ72]MDX2376795.1 sulfite exporter TauE/SafE family protein [Microbacterium sp. LRZ72]
MGESGAEPTEKAWNPSRVLLHVGIGLFAGLLSGMFGVGGGVVIVPLLVLLLAYPQRLAAGTSLAAIVPIATVGVASYGLSGDVAWLQALILAAGAVVGAQIGAWLLPRVPVRALQLGFAVFLLAVIVSLFLVVPQRDDPFELTWYAGLGLVGLGLVTGILSGLLGVGGGIIVVPALMLFFGTSDLIARGTSLMMMIPTALSGTIGNLGRRNVNLVGAALIGLSACTTTALGAWIAKSVDPLTGNAIFAVFLVFITAQLVIRALRGRKK